MTISITIIAEIKSKDEGEEVAEEAEEVEEVVTEVAKVFLLRLWRKKKSRHQWLSRLK